MMTAAEAYEARRQATSEFARRVPATLDDATARDIEREVADAGIAFTIEGYELAQQRLAERIPSMSTLQRKTVASSINKAARR